MPLLCVLSYELDHRRCPTSSFWFCPWSQIYIHNVLRVSNRTLQPLAKREVASTELFRPRAVSLWLPCQMVQGHRASRHFVFWNCRIFPDQQTMQWPAFRPVRSPRPWPGPQLASINTASPVSGTGPDPQVCSCCESPLLLPCEVA
jgi:hypothetical protein